MMAKRLWRGFIGCLVEFFGEAFAAQAAQNARFDGGGPAKVPTIMASSVTPKLPQT